MLYSYYMLSIFFSFSFVQSIKIWDIKVSNPLHILIFMLFLSTTIWYVLYIPSWVVTLLEIGPFLHFIWQLCIVSLQFQAELVLIINVIYAYSWLLCLCSDVHSGSQFTDDVPQQHTTKPQSDVAQ